MITAKEARLYSQDASINLTAILERLERRIITTAMANQNSLTMDEPSLKFWMPFDCKVDRSNAPSIVRAFITKMEELGYSWRWLMSEDLSYASNVVGYRNINYELTISW